MTSGLPETAALAAAAVARGEISPVELVTRALERADAWQEATNAFSQLWRSEALDAAREAEHATGGDGLGPLHGVPVAVKDLFDVAGHETTGCSRAYEGRPPAELDAEMVRRLREAGAILIGKTNMHELACGGTNLTSACGPTFNPWDRSRITGGSSGGSGAAVAAGVVPIALGTDTGGSIRIPASLCGCWGLKPTTGRLPLDGVLPLSPSLDTPGPMAGTAGDLALAWQVMAGGNKAQAPGRLQGIDVGLLGGHFRSADQQVLDVVGRATEALRAVGARVVPVDGEGIENSLDVWVDLCWPEFAEAHAWIGERADELLLPETAAAFRRGSALGREARDQARARVAQARTWFDVRMEDVDVLMAPATPYAAPPADPDEVQIAPGLVTKLSEGATSVFTRPVSVSGLPALCFPAGLTGSGLPVGAQFVARRGGDEQLIGLALALEEAGFGAERPPLPNA